ILRYRRSAERGPVRRAPLPRSRRFADMKRSLWRSLEPGFGRRRSIGVAVGLLVALAKTASLGAPGDSSGRAAAGYPRSGWRPGLSPGITLRAAVPALTSSLFPLDNASPPSASDELYARRIRPLLAKNCYSCHGKTKTSGLDLRTREAML